MKRYQKKFLNAMFGTNPYSKFRPYGKMPLKTSSGEKKTVFERCRENALKQVSERREGFMFDEKNREIYDPVRE